jgi:uncharacterized protein YqeY
MSLEQKLQEDMKSALKNGQKFELITLRSALAIIKDERIRLRPERELTDEDTIRVLTSAVKKRRDSIELYKQGDRQDLVEKEENEIAILSEYLPEQLSEDEIRKVVDETIQKLNATSMNDMGKVMGPVMGQLKGKADGKTVQNIVRECLSHSAS